MATARKSQELKLGQFLKKQQEPFVLEVFLSERGKVVKPVNLSKRNPIPRCWKVIRAVCKKIVSRKTKFDGKDGNFKDVQEQEIGEQESDEEKFAFAGNSQFLELFDEGENEIEADEQCKRMEDNKQHSPVSVLEKSLNYETEDSISSSSSDSLHSAAEKPSFEKSGQKQDPSSQYCLSRKLLHQTRQLMFDCVRELVETHEKKERRGRHSNSKEVLATQELQQLILEKIKGWGKQSGDISNITQLLDSDFIDSTHEWSDFQSERRDVGADIADAILNEITREIVIDLKGLNPLTKMM